MLKKIDISTLPQLQQLAEKLADTLPASTWIYLQGDLGSGKTTFAQYFIAAKGYQGHVTSPTYAIMQDYSTDTGIVIHCDLYRLAEAEELEEIGLIDLAYESHAIVLVEWPNKGRGVLPQSTLTIDLQMQGKQRTALLSSGSDKLS